MTSAFEQRFKQYKEQQQQGPRKTAFQKRFEQYKQQNPTGPIVEEEQGPTWLEQNLDVPLGLAGSLGGAAAGFAVGGPPGAVVGGILGGAGGTAGGTVVSETQFKEAEEIDAYAKAVENAPGLWVLT